MHEDIKRTHSGKSKLMMMNKENLLYHYFSNTLSEAQEKTFNDLLENDTEFKTQFLFEKDLKEAISSHEKDVFKAKLVGFEKEISKKETTKIEFLDSKPSNNKSSFFNYRNLGIAASIVLLIGVLGYNSFFGINYNTLYSDNYNAYPNTVYTITRGDTNNSIEREAFVAYEGKNYALAIKKWDAILATDSKPYLNFYKAQAYLNLEDTQNAKRLFKQVITSDEDFVAQSTWYLALISLKEESKSEAKMYLEQLIVNFDYNNEKAQTLLKTLN